MIYFQIYENKPGEFVILDMNNHICSPTKYFDRSRARAALYQITSDYLRRESEEAYKFGAEFTLELWTWKDKVMDGDGFVKEYEKEFNVKCKTEK